MYSHDYLVSFEIFSKKGVLWFRAQLFEFVIVPQKKKGACVLGTIFLICGYTQKKGVLAYTSKLFSIFGYLRKRECEEFTSLIKLSFILGKKEVLGF